MKVKIFLNTNINIYDLDKINEIKLTMSKIHIAPPFWASDVEDKKLMELLKSFKNKE